MTDKERILTTIVRELCTTQLLAHHAQDECIFQDNILKQDGCFVHFQYEGMPLFGNTKIPVGSLVMCETSGIHDFTVGWLDHYGDDGEPIIREIGTGRLGRVSNDVIRPIVGLRPNQLWEGDEYQFSVKVQKAFKRANNYRERFLRIDMGHPATVVTRIVWTDTTYTYTVNWDKRTAIRAILAQMEFQGFGGHEREKTA